jgi:hypothetical protein
VLDQIVFYLSPMGDTKVPFVTKPCRSPSVRRRRVGNRGARRPRADEGTDPCRALVWTRQIAHRLQWAVADPAVVRASYKPPHFETHFSRREQVQRKLLHMTAASPRSCLPNASGSISA